MEKKQYSVFPFSIYKGLILPILIWLAFTPWSGKLDLLTSRFFYDQGKFAHHFIWDWIYTYAIIPAWILFGLAFIGLILSFNQSYRNWRTPCLYLLLTFAIGAGMIINVGLKEYWSRPRPKQVIEFNGSEPFRPYYRPNLNATSRESNKSFPSGHASSGFYFFSLAFLGAIYHSKFYFRLGMCLAWGLGLLLSLGRIAQGGHFLSDTLATALIMWLTACGLAYLFFFANKPHHS